MEAVTGVSFPSIESRQPRFYETQVFKDTGDYEEPAPMSWHVDLERVESYGPNTGDVGGTVLVMYSGDYTFLIEPIEQFHRVMTAYRNRE